MLHFIKTIVFKFMELGLGVKPCFLLSTKDPIFINFKLDEAERQKVQASLPRGFKLEPLSFTSDDSDTHYWLSYNLYEIRYPKKELAHIKKVRCEINTFVSDGMGRKGIYVFCGSPFVSKEIGWNPIGIVVDLAERLVMWIYGVGQLLSLSYELGDNSLSVGLDAKGHSLELKLSLAPDTPTVRLSRDYIQFNDISFFNEGKTFDLVNSNSGFSLAAFTGISGDALRSFRVRGPFLDRSPDLLLYHRGEIAYLVNAMNKSSKECFA